MNAERRQRSSNECTLEDVALRESFLSQAVWTERGYIEQEDMQWACDVMMRIMTKKMWESGLRRLEDQEVAEGTQKTKKRRSNPAMFISG